MSCGHVLSTCNTIGKKEKASLKHIVAKKIIIVIKSKNPGEVYYNNTLIKLMIEWGHFYDSRFTIVYT